MAVWVPLEPVGSKDWAMDFRSILGAFSPELTSGIG